MIPVDQTILKPPMGNCYAACLASVFEVPLETVPHPTAEEGASAEDWSRYEERLEREFLGPRGLRALYLQAIEGWHPYGYSILSAISPRGEHEHAVVCLDGAVVHDPHPDRHMGIGKPMTWIVFQCSDPAAFAAGARS